MVAGNTADQSSNGIIRIFGYDLSRDKVAQNVSAGKFSDTSVLTGTFAVAWKNTAAINRIRLDDNGSMTGNGFLAGDIFKTIGFKNS